MQTCEQHGKQLSLLQGPCLARPPPTLRPGPSVATCAVTPPPQPVGDARGGRYFWGRGCNLFHLSFFVLWSLLLLFKEWGGEGVARAFFVVFLFVCFFWFVFTFWLWMSN